MKKYKRIFITGKSGTVGSNLNFGVGVSSKEVNFKDFCATDKWIKDNKPDSIVHLAAKVGGLKLHLENKYDLLYDNLLINLNVIEAAKKNNVKRVLSYMSSCIYSEASKSPYCEKMIHDGNPFPVHYPYGHAKRILEVQSRICYEEFGLVYNCVIPTNIYGLYDDFNLETGHVIGVLIHKAYLAKKNNTPFVVWGNGRQVRDFIFTEDIALLTEWALHNYKEKEPLIFSNNCPIEIGYIAELISKKFGIEKLLKFDASAPTGQKSRILNGNKLKSLNAFQFTTIEDGISKSIDWFLSNYPNVRL